DTGPLVYPAAFVYIYSALYFLTSSGQNIRLAQYVFGVIYLLQMWLVLRLYSKSRKVPPYVLVISAFTSYRIHSIYILRLFNDPIAILFLYAALNLFMDRHWTWGSICFSLGVGCKMNILLFAPALFLFYLINLGLTKTILQLAVCGLLQLLLGLPFLVTYPWQYIKGSFDLGRIFEHKWTVNYRFLPREYFENKFFHLALLSVHLLLLLAFAKPHYIITKTENKQDDEENLTPEQEAFLQSFEKGLQKSTVLKHPYNNNQWKSRMKIKKTIKFPLHFDQCTQLACAFLPVQFYWYFMCTFFALSILRVFGFALLVIGSYRILLEYLSQYQFFQFYLHICHIVLLVGVGRNMFKSLSQSAAINKQQELNNSPTAIICQWIYITCQY
ncbi:hypothetical protein DOY81_012007, partial [Sarcophaga bullata]